MSIILQGKLYLGSFDDAMNIEWIQVCGITDVITVVTDIETVVLTSNLTEIGVKHHVFDVHDTSTQDLSYLMQSHRMYLDDAILFVLKSRLCIFPNDGFIAQLMEFEKQTFGTQSFLPNKDGFRKFKSLIHNFEGAVL